GGAGDRSGQPRLAAAMPGGRADPAQTGPSVHQDRDPLFPRPRPGRPPLGQGRPRARQDLPRPQPPVRHRRLQQKRRPRPERQPRHRPRPRRGLPLLARLGCAEHEQRLRRPGRERALTPGLAKRHQLRDPAEPRAPGRHPTRGDGSCREPVRRHRSLQLMIKETPSPLRIVAMVVFALSVFGLLMFLWLSFGGSIPLRPKGYRVEVAFPEAATLAQEADVRMAGVNIGKVKKKRLDKGGARTIVELELKSQYAPIPKDSRAILRQKTLLGETYVQLSEGHKSAGMLPDHGRLANDQVEPTTELDEIFSAFDKPTRAAFQDWVQELARAIQHHSPGPAENLNDAFGNLPGFAVDGAKL